MASIAIPLITAAIPILTPIINDLVQRVESLFPRTGDTKTGETKFQTVLNAVTPVAQQLGTSGKIPGQIDPAMLGTMIETVVQQLKAAGVIGAVPATRKPVTVPLDQAGTYVFSGTFKPAGGSQ